MRLENKIAIITGAAGGMGQAAAILFAQEGAKVAVVDLDESMAQLTVDQIRKDGGYAIAIGADITCTEDVNRIIHRTIDEIGIPTVLLNNAGVDIENMKPTIEITEEAFDRTIEVNLKGPWLMMKYVAPHMIQAGGGSIINTASIGAFIAANTAGYCASKAGVVALTRVAALELGRFNIRVNSLCPGATMTPMATQQYEEMVAQGVSEETIKAALSRMSVLGRIGEPIEMAKMALFLASDESSFATGASFINDGGWTITSGVEVSQLNPSKGNKGVAS